MMFNRGFRTIRQNIDRATSPWVVGGKRRYDRRAPDDPLRHVRLRGRRRTFARDAASSRPASFALVLLMTVLAVGIGLRLARLWELGLAGTVLAPFVLVALSVAMFDRVATSVRVLILSGGLVFLLWPLLL